MITGGKLDSIAGMSMHDSAGLSSLNRAPVKDLPGKATVLGYAESNSTFRKKLLDTYHALPYAVQARADMFSPQFFEDLERLKKKGLSAVKIAEELRVSSKTVVKRLRQIGS
jgi:hypothetical protein